MSQDGGRALKYSFSQSQVNMCVRIVESEPMTSVVGVAAGAGAASFLQGDDAGSVVAAQLLRMLKQQPSE